MVLDFLTILFKKPRDVRFLLNQFQESLCESILRSLVVTWLALKLTQVARSRAEEQVKALEVTDEFGLHLAELTLQQDGALPVRQLASVLLKQYIDVHWSCEAARFRAPEAPPATKAAIRAVLPHGLKESISKVSGL